MNIIVTCEHGDNTVPARYRELFNGRDRLLNSHRGYDRYALFIAKSMADKLSARLFFSTVTRLLIDLNRSPHHPKLFSSLSGGLGADEKKRIFTKYYLPYRRDVESRIAAAASRETATFHLSVHSFAPVISGTTKKADIGLLYDPSRLREKALCIQWQKSLQKTAPLLRVRRNYPYLGRADGLVTYCRKIFSPVLYVGVELEVNQKTMKQYEKQHHILCEILVSGLRSGLFQR
ncbi:MAG: hypothetical protein AMK71_00775 [Nitrospira bacterium SG8_35_4]|nr:MAG: hypothetical protein AMK71_00775 [Nitrospira bacterium SG8_35_4]